MTVTDLRCDVCGSGVVGPSGGPVVPGRGGVRFVYHPGQAQLRDDSGLLCESCWNQIVVWLGRDRPWRRCAACGESVTRVQSLHLRRGDESDAWQLCARHAVEFLNRLRTVQPKLDPATFRFPPAAAGATS